LEKGKFNEVFVPPNGLTNFEQNLLETIFSKCFLNGSAPAREGKMNGVYSVKEEKGRSKG